MKGRAGAYDFDQRLSHNLAMRSGAVHLETFLILAIYQYRRLNQYCAHSALSLSIIPSIL